MFRHPACRQCGKSTHSSASRGKCADGLCGTCAAWRDLLAKAQTCEWAAAKVRRIEEYRGRAAESRPLFAATA